MTTNTSFASWRKKLGKYPIGSGARQVLRGLVNPQVLRWTLSRRDSTKPPLLIAGSPRSGTTWLAELAATIPGSVLLFEPMHLQYVPQARRAGFNWNTYVERGRKWPEGAAFFRRLFDGRILNRWLTAHTAVSNTIHPTRLIVKFVRANLLLPWLLEQFPECPATLIMRHPCATIASQVRQGWVLRHSPKIPGFFPNHPEFEEIVSKLGTEVQYMAAVWCIEQYVPLVQREFSALHITTFERLVCDGEAEVERFFSSCGCETPAAAYAALNTASQKASRDAAIRQGRDPLLEWQRILSASEVTKILDVVKQFGLDFYSREPEPDLDRLHTTFAARGHQEIWVPKRPTIADNG